MPSSATATLAVPAPLEGPFNTPPSAHALEPVPATVNLVKSQVEAMLLSSPSYHELSEKQRSEMSDNLVKIGSYAAECMRDMCWQSAKLGQTPVVRKRESISGPLAQAQTSNFQPSAANQIGRVTQETLKAVAFPTFVADLIRGTFNAIVQTSIQQMEAFSQMLTNVTKTVDQFMEEHISDKQARDWLQQRYPEYIRVHEGKAIPVDGAEAKSPPNFQADLKLSSGVSLDESGIEETLVPAARRTLAESRLQMLSTLVLMGVNRIVITGGKIRATMGFHIDTRDRAHEEHATDLDTRAAAAGSFGFGPWSVSASMSVSYVSSTRSGSDSEINVETDLTGEVELQFKSDYFPVERFATKGMLGSIQNNTAVPEANAPMTSNPLGSGVPAPGGDVPRFTSPRTKRSDPPESKLPPIGSALPPAKVPVEPAAPVVKKNEDPTPPPAAEGGDAPAATPPVDGAKAGEGDKKDAPAADAPADPAAAKKAGAKKAGAGKFGTGKTMSTPLEGDPPGTTSSFWSTLR